MKVDTFFSRIQEVSKYLPIMPDYRNANRALTEDEEHGVLEHAVPEIWQARYLRTGRATTMSLPETLDFFRQEERLQVTSQKTSQ